MPNNKTQILEVRKLVGSWIRAIREDKGLTQQDVAKLLEVDDTTISKIEAGRWAVSIDYIARLSVALDFFIFLVPKESEDPLAKVMRDRWDEMRSK